VYYSGQTGDNPETWLRRAIKEANADIFSQNRGRTDHRQMATTTVAAVIRGDDLTVANVGDSRAYLIRGDTLEQITEDHSLMAEMINDGVITPDQAATHPYRNVILRSLGAYETVQVDLFFRQIAPDDTLLLCSDGLTHLVSNKELVDVACVYPPAEATRQLVDLANERGGDDNISVSITRIAHAQIEGDTIGAGALPDAPRWEDLQHP
jgi:protein phosphatase